jgi:4'-phosphopantetheinyl transferase EntD
MRNGPHGLCKAFYPASVRLIDFVLAHYPFLDPTETGRRRAMMDASNHVIAVLSLLLCVLLIPAGICQYIAMKLAPDAQWPEENGGVSKA